MSWKEIPTARRDPDPTVILRYGTTIITTAALVSRRRTELRSITTFHVLGAQENINQPDTLTFLLNQQERFVLNQVPLAATEVIGGKALGRGM